MTGGRDREGPWRLERGATAGADATARFAVWAPFARRVAVLLGGGDGQREVALAAGSDGVFEAIVDGVPPGTDYRYRLTTRHGTLERPDPVSRFQPRGVHGPSRLVDPAAFRWHDDGWRGLSMADYVIYELHTGTFTEAGTFTGVIEHLPYLRELGISAVELMPVGEFPGGRNWGYDGVGLYAPQSTYGGPDGLRRLVDAAHRAGLAVVLDVVYNHLGPEGNHLGDFGPYFTDRHHTPWGRAVNYDGADSDEVRRYVLDNALYWVTEFHMDALRLDAVHALVDTSPRHILAELAAAVHEQARRLGRAVQVIAESDENDPRLVQSPEQGGHGLDALWSDDFHHAVHAALTGERSGYYVDFGGAAAVAKALRDRFVYDGRHSAFRRRRHGTPAAGVPADRFVVFVQNHDQVGNRPAGERLADLVPFPQLKLAASLLLLSPYVPLLFMGEEYGETNPFLYFVSHGTPELIEAVRRGRRAELATVGWTGEAPDPEAEETFRRSRLDRGRLTQSGHRELLSLYRDLLALRRAEPALRPGAAECQVTANAEAGSIVLLLAAPAAPELLAAFNLTGTDRSLVVPIDHHHGWRLLLSTEAPRYGGDMIVSDAALAGATVTAPAFSATLYRREAR